MKLSTYDFSTRYTKLPHNRIKDKLNTLIEWIFHRDGFFYLACNGRNAFFSLPKSIEIILYGHVRQCVKLSSFY